MEDEDTVCGDKHQVHFLETLTTIEMATGDFNVIHASKSWMNMRKGKAPLKSVTHFDTHTPFHQKFGFVVGTLVRVFRNSVGQAQMFQATSREMSFMEKHGMTLRLADAAMRRLHHIVGRAHVKE